MSPENGVLCSFRETRFISGRACKVLLAFLCRNEEGKSLPRTRDNRSPSCGDLARAGAMDQGDNKIAAGSQNLGNVAGPQARAIFPKADIAYRMRTVFDTPMPRLSSSKRSGLVLEEESKDKR